MQARKIIICIDGTGNEIGDNESNILKLYKGLQKSDSQIVHYVPGIGTMDGPRLFGSEIQRKTKALAGLAFGMGLEDDVLDAYRFICRNYQDRHDKSRAARRAHDALKLQAARLGLPEPDRGPKTEAQNDQIYVFGFSRGAYAARILAGFINNFGLLSPDRLHMVTEVFRAYRKVTDYRGEEDNAVVFRKLRQFGHALRPKTRVPIQALGLFDTVASIVRFTRPIRNLVRLRSPMELATHASVKSNPSVRIVLHALAVDERRSMFRALHWKESPYFGHRFGGNREGRQQYVEQRWFPGYHSDIGGTPREFFSGIGKITLMWMLEALKRDEARAYEEDQKADPSEPGVARPRPEFGLRLKRGYRRRVIEVENRDATTVTGERYARPDSLAPTHNSMKLAWVPLEILPKTTKRREWPGRRGIGWYLPFSEPREIPADHVIDDSVYDRMARWKFYRPVNVRGNG